MHYTSPFTGYCPQIKDERQISVELSEIKMTGKNPKQYKKVGIKCPDYDNCQNLDNHGRCSLFISAPNHP